MAKNSKLTDFQINSIKVLRANGVSYDKIATGLQLSIGSVYKYGKDIPKLPKAKRRDPYELLIHLQGSPKLESPEAAELKKAVKEKTSWIENYELGTRFTGPTGILSLDELCDLMVEPTNYISPLGQTDWYNTYIAPLAFRGTSLELCNTQILLNHFFDTNMHGLAAVFRRAVRQYW